MTDTSAGQRLGLFDHRRGWQLGILGASITLLLTVAASIAMGQVHGESAVDFHVFWAAAKLALAGAPLDTFDVERLAAAAGFGETTWMPWAYPPGFLLLLLPLGALPATAAYAVFTALSLAALALAVRPLAEGRLQVLFLIALAPALLPGLIIGQTSTLWAAGIVAALAAMRAERPWLAGLFIGLLTLKPQLGLLIPVALLAGGEWRTILSAVLTTLALAVVPTLVFGAAYWPAMLTMMSEHGETVRSAINALGLMVSPYSFLVSLGLTEPVALGLQWFLTALCALAVWLAWRSPALPFDARAAVLLTAMPLASPYLWHYESALYAPALLFMWRAGILTPIPWHIALAALMWVGLSVDIILGLEWSGAQSLRLFYLPVALTALALSCLTVYRHSQRLLSQPGSSA